MDARRDGQARPAPAQGRKRRPSPVDAATPPRPAGPQRSQPVRTPGANPRKGTRTSSSEIHTRPRRPDGRPQQRTPGTARPTAARTRPATAGAPVRRRTSGLLKALPLTPRTVGRGIVVFLTVMVLLITGLAWGKVNSLNSSVTLLGGLGLGGSTDGATDILLVGTDSRVDAKGNPLSPDELKWLRVGDDVTTSTDTILLIRIPDDGSAATAISIPRDSYVDVPGIGKTKINSAYGTTKEGVRRRAVESGKSEKQAEQMGEEAGRRALIETVGNLTGVTVDHYAEVGLLGFALLTDAVGGVDVCLKNAVNEPLSGARFRAGKQTLTGPKALSFVRQRHDLPRGDLDRIKRQQVYMASLAQKILSAGTLTNPTKLKELEGAVSRSVVMDDGWDVVSLADQMKNLTGGNVKFTTIPVVTDHGWSDDGTQSVVEVDPTQVKNYVSGQLGKTDPKANDGRGAYHVDVVNAGTVDGLATNVEGLLMGKGYLDGTTSTKPMNSRDSIVFARKVDSEGAKQLVKDLGGDITIQADPSLPDDRLRAVLTNTYTGMGALSDTGDQGENANDGSSQSGADRAAAAASAPIKADTNGPVCVN
ncbi:MAG: LCP family protein [Gordonia sp. (in: high G+C Gram-positive bacteria)]|uniref:LCP family protein n=1 Tax=Gordonia sp. (in: high G+C Gram-positive bacteria) TaxID=84139 RepID=UPI0039E4266B